MGYKLKCKSLCLSPNEEEDLIIELEYEDRAAIHGVVLIEGRPVENAVVKLFAKKENCFVPVTFSFTDSCGQFLFGVQSNVEYIIKVFYYEPEQQQSCDTCPPIPRGKKVQKNTLQILGNVPLVYVPHKIQ